MNSVQLPESDIWSVRAERGNALAGIFLERGIVSMGWGIGPIRHNESRNEIVRRLAPIYPDKEDGTLQAWANQIKRFNSKMEVGDGVAAYEPQTRICHIGIIRDPLIPIELDPLAEWGHDYVHRVEWLYQVPRYSLSEYTWKRLGHRLTLIRLSREASPELRQHCAQ